MLSHSLSTYSVCRANPWSEERAGLGWALVDHQCVVTAEADLAGSGLNLLIYRADSHLFDMKAKRARCACALRPLPLFAGKPSDISGWEKAPERGMDFFGCM